RLTRPYHCGFRLPNRLHACRQKEILFMRGNAMSDAPIISGTSQLPKPPIRAGITMQGHITGKTNVWRITGKTNVWRISQELSVDSGRRWNILQRAKTPCENNMETSELQTAQCVPQPDPRFAITGGYHERHRPRRS